MTFIINYATIRLQQIYKGFKMTLTLGKIKNTKQAKRAITAIQSAFNITPIIGKEVIVKDNAEALKTKDNEISVLNDLSKKQAKDIEELNAHIEDLNNQLSDLSNKESDIRFEYTNLKATCDQLKKDYKTKEDKIQKVLVELETLKNSIKPFNLNSIEILRPIETPFLNIKTEDKYLLENGMKDEDFTIIEQTPQPNALNGLPTPKMDGSLMVSGGKKIEKKCNLIKSKDEHVEGLKTAFENGLDGRIMLDSEEDYTPPKIDLSVRAIPLKIFIRDKEKSINNSDSKNEEIRELLSGYRVTEIESNVTVSGYKKIYSNVAKYLNRDTLKLIKKIFLASSSNTVKKAYRKPYYDLLTKIYNIIITDRLPIDDIEPQKEADNIKPIAEDKTPLKSDIEAIKASVEAKTRQAINNVENPTLTTRDEVFNYAINQVKVAKVEADKGIPMPYAKAQRVLKDLESFISKKDILHLLNILIGDDIFRGNSYDRYIPNIKYWNVLRGIKKGLKTK